MTPDFHNLTELIRRTAIVDVYCGAEGTHSCILKNPEEIASKIIAEGYIRRDDKKFDAYLKNRPKK